MDLKQVLGRANWALMDRRFDPQCYIACHGKTDGAGAQIQAYISTIAFARTFGFRYVHMPFETMELSPDGDAIGWAETWEKLMALGEGEFPFADLPEMPQRGLRTCRNIRKRRNELQVPRHCLHWIDTVPDCHAEVMPDLRTRYLRNVPARFKQESSGPLRIALHVKRNDPGNAARLTANEIVASTMRGVAGVLDALGVAYRFEICSLGSEDDFEEMKPFNPLFRLNESAVDTFHAMTSADMLLTAKSSYSYVAALYNKGVVLYEPFWHPSLSNWVSVKDGAVDLVSLRRETLACLDRRSGKV